MAMKMRAAAGIGMGLGVVVAMAALLVQAASAQDACTGFKWDVAREHALFSGAASAADAGATPAEAPLIALDRLYQIALLPQETLRFAAPSSKKMLADGASAGLLRFRVPRAGSYRVSVDAPFWLDVVADGKTIASTDFNGSPGCDKPRKIVVYSLPADTELMLQLSAAPESQVRVSVTAVGKAAP